MRARHLYFVAGLLVLTAALTGWFAARTRRAAEASLVALAAERAALAARLGPAERRQVEAVRAQSDLRQAIDRVAPAKSPGGAPAAKSGPPPPAAPRTMTEIIANDPKAEVLMLRWQREVVALEYGPFFRREGIAAEQVRRFQDNWVKRVERDIDLGAAARAQAGTQQTVEALQQQSKAEYEAGLKEVLGPETYARFQEFERHLPLQNSVVRGLAGATALEGIPLTPQQGEELFQAALAAGGAGGGGRAVLAVDWPALDAAARRILSPAQYAIFTTSTPPSGFTSPVKYRLDAITRRAHEADAAAAKPGG